MELKKVDLSNVWDILTLKVAEDQKEFVAPNDLSIIEAYATAASGYDALPFGIYEEGVPVGFVLFGYDMEDEDSPPVAKGNYCIWRFMIDKVHQHKGLGRRALALCVAYVKTFPCGPAECCWLSYEPENERARALYRQAGFAENGQWCGGEMVAALELR